MSGLVALGDGFRVANAVLSCALVFTAAWAIMVSPHWDQRTRFGLFALSGFLLTSGHLASFGQPWTWRLPVLTVVILAAVVSTAAFVRRVVHLRRGGTPRRGWPRDL